MFVTIAELDETTVLHDDDVFAISSMNGSTETTKKIRFSNVMGGMSQLVEEATSSLNGLSFGTDSSGNWGYIKPGADSVTPFRSQADVDDAYRRGRDDGIVEGGAGMDYSEGYALGYAAGQAAVKTAHKLTVPTTRNANVAVTGNWYTTVDNTACYDAGVASVKTAHKLTVPTTKGTNIAVTGNWYTTVDNEACYGAGYNAGVAYADGRENKNSNNYKSGYSAGQGSVITATYVFVGRWDPVPTLTYNTGKGSKLIGASVTGMTGIRFYSWQQNYNAYSSGSVLCTCSNGIITVAMSGTPTCRYETTSDNMTEGRVTVTYWYFP